MTSFKRRDLLRAVGALPALLLSQLAGAQTVHRIAWLSPTTKAGAQRAFEAFHNGMAALGYIAGRNLAIDEGWGNNSSEITARLALELTSRKPTLVVAQGPAMLALRRVSTPVVFVFSGDAVEAGVARSYSRPGANFTGISLMQLDLVGKRIELLREISPKARRLAVIARPDHPGETKEFEATREGAMQLGMEVSYHPVRTASEIEGALAAAAKWPADALVVHPNSGMMQARAVFARYSREQRVPTISGWAEFAEGGNLLSYGPDLQEAMQRLAYFVDRILRGAKPSELPIELPRTVELVVNLNTARAIGVTIPQALLLRANRVIE